MFFHFYYVDDYSDPLKCMQDIKKYSVICGALPVEDACTEAIIFHHS